MNLLCDLLKREALHNRCNGPMDYSFAPCDARITNLEFDMVFAPDTRISFGYAKHPNTVAYVFEVDVHYSDSNSAYVKHTWYSRYRQGTMLFRVARTYAPNSYQKVGLRWRFGSMRG